MKPIKAALLRWKLRRVIAALAHRLHPGGKADEDVYAFAKMLEATEIMTRPLKRDDEVAMSTTRIELEHFIRYMTTLHDSRLGLLVRARIGLATLIVSDKKVLGESAEDTLKTEEARMVKGQESKLLGADGKQMRIKL